MQTMPDVIFIAFWPTFFSNLIYTWVFVQTFYLDSKDLIGDSWIDVLQWQNPVMFCIVIWSLIRHTWRKKSIWLGIIGRFWVIRPVTTVKIVAVCILKIYFPSFSASSPLVLHHSQPWSMTLAISTKKQRVQMIWQYATQPVTLDVHIDQLDTIALFIYHCKIEALWIQFSLHICQYLSWKFTYLESVSLALKFVFLTPAQP